MVAGRQSSPSTEWPGSLDVAELIAGGWQPVPFREFVLKIHSRCDLACDYCYMYTMADQSWRSLPPRMSNDTVDCVAARIAEHVRRHKLARVKVILHGGEPLLAGPELIGRAVSAVRDAVAATARVEFNLQTNGRGLDTAYLELFRELDVRVGVSIDGDADAQDRHRRHANGRGSYAEIDAGLHRLATPSYQAIFGGLLCTIDVRNDPVATYEALLKFRPPLIDFLLPHGNWTSPPVHRIPGSPEIPYGKWLIAVFDRWYSAPRRETEIRLFGDIMHAILGGNSRTEAVGLSPAAVVVIETDGHIEQSDTLKSAYPGASDTGLHISRDALDAVLLQPGFVARQIGVEALSAQCRSCRVMRVCGGGHYAHRYSSGGGFANPSVYCPDLLTLITHISRTMQADISYLRKTKG